jgi:hypothetical protein
MIDFIKNPVITGAFSPKFYWTGKLHEDAERINRPHIKAEGEKENRIQETINIITDLQGVSEITLTDMFNIQNRLLKANNWKGVKAGFRFHNVGFSDTPQFVQVRQLTEQLFPVSVMNKAGLLEWYKQIQTIHPLSDLNGRTFGIILAVLNEIRIAKKID